jgi:hypothetical protein
MAFAAQNFQRVFIVLEYYGNTTAFAASCQNKARPGMHCNGKCQMMKKLKAAEKREQVPEGKTAGKISVLSSRSFFASAITPVSILNNIYFRYINSKATDRSIAVFHPPSL